MMKWYSESGLHTLLMMLFGESSLVSPASSPSSAVFFLLAGLKINIHLLNNNNNNNNSKYNPLIIRQGCCIRFVCDGKNKSSTKHVGREGQT